VADTVIEAQVPQCMDHLLRSPSVIRPAGHWSVYAPPLGHAAMLQAPMSRDALAEAVPHASHQSAQSAQSCEALHDPYHRPEICDAPAYKPSAAGVVRSGGVRRSSVV
jgi:hypothetical protein